MSKYGWELGTSEYFPDVALEDPLNTIGACARLLNSLGFLPENRRAQLKELLKEELNCKKCLAVGLHSHTTRFLLHQASRYLLPVSCAAWLCCRCVYDTAIPVTTELTHEA